MVISKCAELRVNAEGTWISADIQRAYSKLHREGFAHSFEAWHDGELVGGLYGVALGNVFLANRCFVRAVMLQKSHSHIAFIIYNH